MSVAVHVTVVLPIRKPSIGKSFPIMGLGSTKSVNVGVPTSTFVREPVAIAMISAGAIKEGGFLSSITILCSAIAELPAASFAVQVTIVVPSRNPSAGASFLTVGLESCVSLTIGDPIDNIVRGPVAFAVIVGGGIIVGGVLSVTVGGFELESELDVEPEPPPPPPPPPDE